MLGLWGREVVILLLLVLGGAEGMELGLRWLLRVQRGRRLVVWRLAGWQRRVEHAAPSLLLWGLVILLLLLLRRRWLVVVVDRAIELAVRAEVARS